MTIDYRWVQTRLAELGFDPGPIDGIRGPRTDAAVVEFKRSVGLRARSFIGPITLQALLPAKIHGSGANDIPWMNEAEAIRGLHEQRDVAALRRWFDVSVSWIDPREVAWCGAFVATCMRKWQPGVDLPINPLGARNWRRFGERCGPVFGSILVFWRGSPDSWKGHVGFYHGQDDTHFHVLGGNQSNAVTVTRIAKTRLVNARWPKGVPVTGRPVLLRSNGVPVTHNEA